MKYRHLVFFAVAGLLIFSCSDSGTKQAVTTEEESIFSPPDTSTIPHDEFGEMVRYGRKLIVNTAYYIGPEGVAGKYLGNKMNCGNCHLDAGTRPYGLNYFSTHARYPQYRGRENRILSLAERVNNCIERPHLGKAMPLDCKEMEAIICYMRWLAKDVPTGQHVKGDEAAELNYPDRPADPKRGQQVYAAQCTRCHGLNGEGQLNFDSSTYTYPPLWGQYAYESGSSMHRVLKAARFIKANMPNDLAKWNKPFLSDEDAIDVAAFINDDAVNKRPGKKRDEPDYSNVKVKPIDYDAPPFEDTFSALQHKYGPFKPIIDYHKQKGLPIVF
jgi:thiosulfate dehydrogenase